MRLWMCDCSFTQRVLNIYWSVYSAAWLLRGWCHVKLLPSRRKYTIQPCTCLQCHFIRSHIRRMHVLSCNLPPALLAEWAGSFTWCCSNMGEEWIPKWGSAHKIDHGEENSPAVPAGIRTRDLSIASPSLYHWAIHAPHIVDLISGRTDDDTNKRESKFALGD